MEMSDLPVGLVGGRNGDSTLRFNASHVGFASSNFRVDETLLLAVPHL